MSVNQDSQVDQVWSTLNQQQQQEVVNQIRTVIKEMGEILDRHAIGTRGSSIRSDFLPGFLDVSFVDNAFH